MDTEVGGCHPLGRQKDRESTGHVINVVGENQNVMVSSPLAPSAGRATVPALTKMAEAGEASPLDMSEAWRRFLDS